MSNFKTENKYVHLVYSDKFLGKPESFHNALRGAINNSEFSFKIHGFDSINGGVFASILKEGRIDFGLEASNAIYVGAIPSECSGFEAGAAKADLIATKIFISDEIAKSTVVFFSLDPKDLQYRDFISGFAKVWKQPINVLFVNGGFQVDGSY